MHSHLKSANRGSMPTYTKSDHAITLCPYAWRSQETHPEIQFRQGCH